MAERNDMTAALVTAYTSPQLAAINEYLEAEKAVRAAAGILGLDADLMIAEAEGLARATTFSNVEALYFVADQAASGKREVNGHAWPYPPPRQTVQRDLCGSAVGIFPGREHEKFPRDCKTALPNHDHRGNMRPAGPRNRPRGGGLLYVGNVP